MGGGGNQINDVAFKSKHSERSLHVFGETHNKSFSRMKIYRHNNESGRKRAVYDEDFRVKVYIVTTVLVLLCRYIVP
jgi:hypothetical protein